MKRFDGHVSTLQGALQERPEVLRAVGVNLPVNVRLRVIDDVVGVVGRESLIREVGVGVDGRSGFDVLPDVWLHLSLLKAVQPLQPDAALALLRVPLQQPHDGDLTDHRAALSQIEPLPFARVHVAGFAADEGFVDFDGAAELVEGLRLNRHPEPVQHEPCGFLGNAQVAGDFVAADAVLAVHEQPHRGQPLGERNRAILENAADLDGELFPAVFALPDPAGLHERAINRFAVRAADAIRPAEGRDELSRHVHVREIGDRAEQGVWGVFWNHT